ncbi:hypothetical protein GLP30_17280 [Photobacterium phosphoreum]|uniref:Lipoprotein n=1 Tax=Photobacterium phosphoreum TaxID=659 RepID=A0AAW4ZYE7_PHOPO|nr:MULTISPECIES: hypothetical protein [Photobacterium]MCD9492593.1 hypothetical protein [Photobacterium phosphoreum]MCD9516840.1 hypothetical protein [Photobacterium carnosum]MCD9553397.1 hypothetical protein [Photobacterium carnosum]MCF2191842.1 hypothetical protein [Photobacterium phosphoreum]MCF2303425.1 hypothetical protein [Photobacterium phosphoreum]
MKKKVIILATITTLFLSGCGSIINGKTQNMSINTTPDTATISLLSANGSLITKSKGTLFYNLNRSNGYFDGADYNLKIDADGYTTQVVPLVSSASGWYIAGNIALGGLIGWLIVDPATGGMWTLEAKNGQDIENLNVVLLENATDKMMGNAVKVN